MVTIENFNAAKAAFENLKKLDCQDGDYTAKKLQEYMDAYFGSSLIVTEPDYKSYLMQDIKDIENRSEEMLADENELDFVMARLESSLDIYGQVIVDTERELNASA